MSEADVTRLGEEAPHLLEASLAQLTLPTMSLRAHLGGVAGLRHQLATSLDALRAQRSWVEASRRTSELLARHRAQFALEVRESVKGGFAVMSHTGRAFLPRSRSGGAAVGDLIIGHLLKYNASRDTFTFGYTRHQRADRDEQVSRWNPDGSRPPRVFTSAQDVVRLARDVPGLSDALEERLTDSGERTWLKEALTRAWLSRNVPEVMRWTRDMDPDDLPETLRAVALATRGDVADAWAMATTRQNAHLFEVVWRATDPDATWRRG
jgi:hypothetical protein